MIFGFQVFPPETMFPPALATQTGDRVVSVGAGSGPILRSVMMQLSVAGLPAGAGGGCVLIVTGTVVEEVQPVKLLVMSKV